MKKIILATGFIFIININIKAQSFKIGTYTIGNKKNNKETKSLRKKDYSSKETNQKIVCKCESPVEVEYNKQLKKEIRKTKKLARKEIYRPNSRRQKEEIGL